MQLQQSSCASPPDGHVPLSCAQPLVRPLLARHPPLAPLLPLPLASRVSAGGVPGPACRFMPSAGPLLAAAVMLEHVSSETDPALARRAAPAFGQPGLTAFGSTTFGGAAPAAGGFGAGGFGAAGARGTRSVAWRKTQEQDTSSSTGPKSGGLTWRESGQQQGCRAGRGLGCRMRQLQARHCRPCPICRVFGWRC